MSQRTYSDLASSDLDSYASSRGGGYQVANQLTTLIQERLTDTLITTLGDDGVHAIGIEVEATSPSGSAPFSNVEGPIGISVMWYLPGASASSISPAVHAFAIEGSSGPEAIDPQVTLPGGGSGGTNGSLFVCHYTGTESNVDAGRWENSVTTESTILSSNFSLASLGTGLVVPFFGTAELWRGFGTKLTVTSSGGGALNVRYSDCEYRNFEWLLHQFDLVEQSPILVPRHPFVRADGNRMPDWAPETEFSGSFSIGGAISAPGIDQYGGSELYYDPGAPSSTDVSQLQADLWELGFWFKGMIGSNHGNYSLVPGNQTNLATGDASGTFDVVTEWALREFQIYAKMETVAHDTGAGRDRYVENLEPVANDSQYQGEVSGVLNDETARMLQYWLDNDWRCPVVVEMFDGADTVTSETHAAANNGNANRYRNAFTDSHGNSRVVLQNIWQRLDPEDAANPTGGRQFVTDLRDYYDGTATAVDVPPIDTGGLTRPAALVVGDYIHDSRWTSGRPWEETYGGPRSIPSAEHCWPETGEVLPDSVIGRNVNLPWPSAAGATDDTLSTYKVVRASSELECYGYFDSVNGYDLAITSIGPCHWTLALRPGANPDFPTGWTNDHKRNAMKLPTQQTYGHGGDASNHGTDDLREGELPAFFSYLQSADLDAFDEALGNFGVDTDGTWGDDGSSLFNAGGRKYTDKLTLQYRQSDGSIAREPVYRRDGDYFRNWHWFYRIVMACRTIDGFREAMWDMTRIRIRDIRNTLWPEGVTHLPDDGGDPATVGDVVTSERGIALVLRWHIRKPAQVTTYDSTPGGGLGYTLGWALDHAWGGTWNADLSTNDWSGNTGDQHEHDLVSRIVTDMGNEGIGRLDDVEHWPHWGGWQTNGGHPCHYRLFWEGDPGDPSDDGPGSGVNPAGPDLLDNDRDSFGFDSATVGTDSPSYEIRSGDAYLRDPNNGYASVTTNAPLHNSWNGLGYVNYDTNRGTWEVDEGTPVTVTDRDSSGSDAVVEIEHADQGTRIGWTNMGNLL